MCREIFGVRVN